MAGFINALEQDVLDHVIGKATYTAPSNWYVGLSSTTPTEAGANFTEPGGGAYARVITTASSDWNSATAADPSVSDNSSVLTFTTATAVWGTMTHFGLFTGSSGGTVQIWGALSTPRYVVTNDVASFAAGTLDVKMGDPGDSY